MTTTFTGSKSRMALVVISFVLLLIPIVYFLSIGPAIWLMQRDYI